jgi:hypothetical protein
MISFNFFLAPMPTLQHCAFACYVNVMLNMYSQPILDVFLVEKSVI